MGAPTPMEIARQLLANRVLDSWTNYLAAYRVIEGNLALFDKLARCRDFREFEDAIYETARVKARVMEKLKDGIRRREITISRKLEEFDVDEEDLKALMELATVSEQAPRVIGSLVASFALLHKGPERVERGSEAVDWDESQREGPKGSRW